MPKTKMDKVLTKMAKVQFFQRGDKVLAVFKATGTVMFEAANLEEAVQLRKEWAIGTFRLGFDPAEVI